MDEIQSQYEAYPYPERNPKDEAKRLITGSPSWPQEMDHWLWAGARDWTQPLKVLFAGGGTGDGLIQLAYLMSKAGRSYEITYVDLSKASRKIAEARAKERGLKNIRFETDTLLNAPEFGEFDYIDCCGVLHHLPEPDLGFSALANALAPGGGIGMMVYAPHGRAGVYPLQDAFNQLTDQMTPKQKLTLAKSVFAKVPGAHPFKVNPNLVDHEQSDAGFYDLLLHSSDRPYTITELFAALERAGLAYTGTPIPSVYDPAPFLPSGAETSQLSNLALMQIAENLRGSLKTHVVYAKKSNEDDQPTKFGLNAIPHLRGVPPQKLAQSVAKMGGVRVNVGSEKVDIAIPKQAARLIAAVNGKRSLAEIANAVGADPIAFKSLWNRLEKPLISHGFLHYSTFLVV